MMSAGGARLDIPLRASRTAPRALKNVAQVMALCGVCRRTVYNWIRQNKVETVRTPTGRIRIYEDSLLK